MAQGNLKHYKAELRKFLRTAYSDERLAMLLAHAQSEQLAYHSCCCFIGIVTADHRLEPKNAVVTGRHFPLALRLPRAQEAQNAYCGIGIERGQSQTSDLKRRRIIIPMIRAEFKRRAALRAQREQAQEPVGIAS